MVTRSSKDCFGQTSFAGGSGTRTQPLCAFFQVLTPAFFNIKKAAALVLDALHEVQRVETKSVEAVAEKLLSIEDTICLLGALVLKRKHVQD